ncbi:MAG: DUF4142 domain-containing protein [Verrucomicrobiota bacterium]|nr:DUF4142 domain-containing protein [Verrucomicrobiota bacterium]
MVKDHERIAEFEKADQEVKDNDLNKFVEDTLPVMKHSITDARAERRERAIIMEQ